jgi:predicted secreted protein
MSISTAIATYFLVWWIMLFAVLPWGVRPQEKDAPPGTDPGAPMLPRLGLKLIWTTVVAAVVWAIGALVYVNGLVSLDYLANLLGAPKN